MIYAWKHHVSSDFQPAGPVPLHPNGPAAGATVFLDYDYMIDWLEIDGREWHVCEFQCEMAELEFIYDTPCMARLLVEKDSDTGFYPFIGARELFPEQAD